jgi:hypothetical protein
VVATVMVAFVACSPLADLDSNYGGPSVSEACMCSLGGSGIICIPSPQATACETNSREEKRLSPLVIIRSSHLVREISTASHMMMML